MRRGTGRKRRCRAEPATARRHLQNRQAVAAPRLDGSTPSPLRYDVCDWAPARRTSRSDAPGAYCGTFGGYAAGGAIAQAGRCYGAFVLEAVKHNR
jgi:hypothetical protein